MKARLAQVRWGLVLTTAVVLYIATFILGVALSFPWLAFLERSQLDSQLERQVASLISALLVIVVTGFGALWAARRAEHEPMLHGFLVGLVVAILSLVLDVVFRPITLVGLLLYLLMVAAGLLGGVLDSRRREQP